MSTAAYRLDDVPLFRFGPARTPAEHLIDDYMATLYARLAGAPEVSEPQWVEHDEPGLLVVESTWGSLA